MKWLLVLGLFCLLIGCVRKGVPDQRKDVMIPLVQGNTEQIKDGRDLFCVVDSLVLQCTSESVISKFDRVLMNDSFIVAVGEMDPLPIVFNRRGEYLNRIGEIGFGKTQIKNNHWTQINDSMVLVLTWPQGAINCYSFTNQFIKSIPLKKTHRIFHCFYEMGSELFLINIIFEPNGLLFAQYDLTSDSLTPLWSIYTESENNKYKGCKTHHISIQYAFSNGQSFLCSTQEYKIRHWVGDSSIGYYTNPYFPYEFLEIDSVSEKECEEKYKRNWLNMNCVFRLYFVEDRYLLVDLWQRDGDMATDTVNRTASDGIIMTYYDLIDTQQKKIYSHIPKSNHFFIGTWNNLFIERDIINEAKPMNDNPAYRCIKLYRLNTDKLL